MLNELHKSKIKYLSQFRYTDEYINRKLDEIEEWRARAERITTILTGQPKSSGYKDKVGDNVSEALDRIEEEKKTINKDIEKLTEVKKEIENKINEIDDDTLKIIMIDRYIHFKTWEQIAEKNCYSFQHVYRLHEKALNKIAL